MKKIYLIACLLCFLVTSCSKEEENTEATLGQLSVTLTDEAGKPIKDAFVIMSGLEKNRLINMGEGRSKEGGKWIPYYKGSVEGYISVIAPGYEPKKEKVSYDGKHENKMEITMKSAESLSIMSYNVLEGFQGNEAKKQRFANWVQTYTPDIMLFQELNGFSEQKLLEFAQSYGHAYAYVSKNVNYSQGITSKYPITDVEKIMVGNSDGIYTYHGFMHAKCQDIDIFVIHLSPKDMDDRIKEMKDIVAKKVKLLPADAKVLIAGDFNSYNAYDAKAYGSKFKTERLQYAPSVPVNFEATNHLLENGFKDAFTLFSNGHFKQSIPVSTTEFPENKGSRYDYIMLSDNLAEDCIYSDILREKTTNVLSDHYPNYIRLKTGVQ